MAKDTFKQFVNKDGYAKGGIPVEESSQNLELDPRSTTTADKAFNYIATGKPELPVGGQRAMLPEKKRNSKAY